MYVYRITNKVNGKAYIGITTRTLEKRWREHLNAMATQSKTNRALYGAMHKYGVTNFAVDHLFSAFTLEGLKATERALISQYETLAPNGYNLTAGGDGVWGYKWDKEVRERIAAKIRGRKHTPEHIEKCRRARVGLVMPREAVERSRTRRTGAKRTPEQCARISAGRMGKGLLNTAAQKYSDALIKQVFVLHAGGVRQAFIVRVLGLEQGYVSQLLSGKRGKTRMEV